MNLTVTLTTAFIVLSLSTCLGQPTCERGILTSSQMNVTHVVGNTTSFSIETVWRCEDCEAYHVCIHNDTFPCPVDHKCAGGVATECQYNEFCLGGKVEQICPELAGPGGCETCPSGLVIRDDECVPGKTIDACVSDHTLTIQNIQNKIDDGQCKTVCYEDEPDWFCDYMKTNYEESEPSTWLIVFMFVIVVCSILLSLSMDTCIHCSSIDIERQRTPNTNNEQAMIAFVALLPLFIVLIAVASTQFALRAKQGEHSKIDRGVGIMSVMVDGVFRHSPMYRVYYNTEQGWIGLVYMDAQKGNWQQSEKIMMGNLQDLSTSHQTIQNTKYLLRTRETWRGDDVYEYKPVLRVDRSNLHNANLCIEAYYTFGSGSNKSEVCQARSLGAAIVAIVVGIFGFFTITIMTCMITG